MNTSIQTFQHSDFCSIRTITINDEPWFVGKDVAQALGYGDTDQTLRKHVDAEDKLTRQIDGSGQGRNMTLINEFGIYSLIFKGFRLFDKVLFNKKEYFVFGRRSTGAFDIKNLLKEKVNKGSVSFKKLKLLETRKYYLTERR